MAVLSSKRRGIVTVPEDASGPRPMRGFVRTIDVLGTVVIAREDGRINYLYKLKPEDPKLAVHDMVDFTFDPGDRKAGKRYSVSEVKHAFNESGQRLVSRHRNAGLDMGRAFPVPVEDK